MKAKQISLDRDAEILRIIAGNQGINRQDLISALGISPALFARSDARLGNKLFRQKGRMGIIKYFTAEYAKEKKTPATTSYNGSYSIEELISSSFLARVKQIDSLWITGRG